MAKNSISHFPSFTSSASLTPKHIFRIDRPFNCKEARVVVTPECFLKVRLVRAPLRCHSVHPRKVNQATKNGILHLDKIPCLGQALAVLLKSCTLSCQSPQL